MQNECLPLKDKLKEYTYDVYKNIQFIITFVFLPTRLTHAHHCAFNARRRLLQLKKHDIINKLTLQCFMVNIVAKVIFNKSFNDSYTINSV